MEKFSKARLLSDHKEMVHFTRSKVNHQDYEDALMQIEYLATFAYKYSYLNNFSDNELEQLLKTISNKICGMPTHVTTGNNRRIVIVDSFAYDNRNFTQQYLHALWDLGYEILFIRTFSGSMDMSRNILTEIEKHPATQLLIVDSTLSYTERIRSIVAAIASYAPSEIFMQLTPWDVTAVTALHQFPHIRKYQIDFTDHAFWLGTHITDRLLVFRDWGAYMGKVRGISEDRIYKQPTYPVLDESIAFKGFPVDTAGKIIGFSGGSTYKIRDKHNTFLNSIADLLNKHPKFIFLFAEVGSGDFIRDFIRRHKLEEQFILIGNRVDIYQVYKHVDLYINTYPYGGGNMLLYAAATGTPILTLSDRKLLHTHLNNIIDGSLIQQHGFFDIESFQKGASELIENEQLRHAYSKTLSHSIPTRENFVKRLKGILENEIAPETDITDYNIDKEYLFQTHFLFENLDSRKYYQHLRKFYGLKGAASHKISRLLPMLYYSLIK